MSTLAIKQKTEDAILAYLENEIALDPGSPLDDEAFGLEAAHGAVEFTLPCSVIECPRARELADGSGWFVVDLVIHMFTAMDEVGDTEAVTCKTIHPDRISQMTNIINQLIDGNLNPLNIPDTGPDEREIKEFHCFGVALSEETADQEESHLFDQLRFEVHCMPYDGVAPQLAELFINGDVFIQ